jgi:hypothetical protein
MEALLASKKLTNPLKVNLLFNLMDLAITCCKSATLTLDGTIPERALASAKKSYWDALQLSATVSFNAQQVAEFEWRSMHLESFIRQFESKQTERNEVQV